MRHSTVGLLLVTAMLSTPLFGNQGTVPAENLIDAPAAGETKTCVYARDIKRFEILSDELFLLYAKSDRVLLNRLATRCSGLRKNMVLQIGRYGSQLCANDRIEAHHRGALAGEGFATSCRLGDFESIVPEQVVVLRRSLETS
jgi:hypothetical protein